MVSEYDFLTALRDTSGVLLAEPLGRDVLEEVVEIERGISNVSGGMRLENRGIMDCYARSDSYVVFSDASFPRPDCVTMEMVDDGGMVIGHDVPPGMMHRFEGREDVIWMADSFVLFPKLFRNMDVRMVMLSSRLSLPGIPDTIDARMFYPSVSSAEAVGEAFGILDRRVSAIIVGVDGLDGISSCGLCGEGSPMTARPS